MTLEPRLVAEAALLPPFVHLWCMLPNLPIHGQLGGLGLRAHLWRWSKSLRTVA